MDSIRILEGVYLEFTRTPWQCSMAATLREVLMDSRWTPGKLQVNSRYCVWSLFGLLMESIRMRGSVSQAPNHHHSKKFEMVLNPDDPMDPVGWELLPFPAVEREVPGVLSSPMGSFPYTVV